MKRIIYLIAILAGFSSCDDGDIVIENLNFSNTSINTCSTSNTASGLLFKINGSELLLLDVPVSLFNTTLSTAENPKIHTLANNQILYRKYSGSVNTGVICNTVPPATPTVVNQWEGQPGGTIEVITTVRETLDTTTGTISITGYIHDITFKNIQLKNEQNSFVYENYYFGQYIVSVN